jgi:type II secretory pathway component PulF
MLRGLKLAEFLERFGLLLSSGIPISEALSDISTETPAYEDELEICAQATRKGISASQTLFDNNIIDKQAQMIIDAGEQSGYLSEVLIDYSNSEVVKATQKAEAIKQLWPPFVYMFSAIGVIYGLLVGVVPALSTLGGSGSSTTFIFQLSESVVTFHENYFYLMVVLLVGSIVGLAFYVQSPEGENKVKDILIKTPFIGDGLRLLEYSQWSSLTCVCVKAGIGVKEAFNMTTPMIAPSLQYGFTKTLEDALNVSWEHALNRRLWDEEDERRLWPLMLVSGLRDGGLTGNMDNALKRIADNVGRLGEKKVAKSLSIVTWLAMSVSFALVGTAAFTLIYAQIGGLEALKNG